MQQRRVRLGDILDDYCPRERRITNHVVVAMIEDEVKQTRCTTCDADHEFKQAKLPATRRKKPEGTLVTDAPAVARAPVPALEPDAEPDSAPLDDEVTAPAALFEAPAPVESVAAESAESADAEAEPDASEDQWVHRPLIRATLPRPEGQVPERKAPDFTIRQNGGRFDGQRNGNNRHRGPRQAPHSPSQPRFTNPRSGSGHGGPRSGSGQGGPGQGQPSSGQGQRQGNRPGPPGGQRGGGRPAGQGRGQGRGPKRGR